MSERRVAAVERLRHMAEAADAVGSYVARGRSAFDSDPAVRDAILYRIIVLGEAAKAALAADPAIASDFPAVDWSPVARMRDRIAHHYWSTDPDIVWTTASESVPLFVGRSTRRSAL